MPFDATPDSYVPGATKNLWLDFETHNEHDIDRGAYRYSETAEVIIGAYAFDDSDVFVWDATNGVVYRLVYLDAAPKIHANLASPTYRKPTLEFEYTSLDMPDDLLAALEDDDVTITAHNASFDRQILEQVMQMRPRLERWRCTMVRAYSHAYPGSLDHVGKLLNLPPGLAKLETGKRLINLFCKPQPGNRKVRRHTSATKPQEWADFLLYGGVDVAAMREVGKRLPTWNWKDTDIALWHFDQRINDHGIPVDRELVAAGAKAAAVEKIALAEEWCTIIGEFNLPDGHLPSPGTPQQRDKFKAYLNTRFGLDLDNTRKDTFQPLVDAGEMDPACHRLMELSILANKTSTAKYAALYPAIQDDDRYRGGLQFRGAARTRRYAGRLFQAQNLPSRGLPDQCHIDTYVAALKGGIHDLLFGDLMLYGSAALRSCIVASEGKTLAVADLSNIEGRITSWLAGETWKLQAFREYDAGLGPDLYKITASNILGGTPDDVSKTNRNVFGKVPELACLVGDTRIVTDAGLVRLDEITTQHKLWDGTEWVTHCGLLNHGQKVVVNLDGIEATPDHLIKTGTTWMPVEQLVSNENYRSQALKTGSAALPSYLSSTAPRGVSTALSFGATAGTPHTLPTSQILGRAGQRAATVAQNGLRLARCAVAHAKTSARKIFGGSTTARAPQFGGVTIPAMPISSTMADAASAFTSLGSATVRRSCSISRRSTDGTIPSWRWIAPTLTGITNPAICGSSPRKRTGTISALSGNCSNEFSNLKTVYDIANAGPRNRFTIATDSGFLIAHNCGYEGGFGAFQTFAKGNGLRTPDGRSMSNYSDTIYDNADKTLISAAKGNWGSWGEERNPEADPEEWLACEVVKLAWRRRHPATVKLWKLLKEAAHNAVNNPGQSFKAGQWLTFAVKKHAGVPYLLCRLPSGNFLCYAEPKIASDGTLTYMGIDATATGGQFGKWQRLYTYGGKLLENASQSIALDVMMANVQAIKRAGYDIILSVHDEFLTEVLAGGDHQLLTEIMSRVPAWARGLPLAADGFTTQTYRKG